MKIRKKIVEKAFVDHGFEDCYISGNYRTEVAITVNLDADYELSASSYYQISGAIQQVIEHTYSKQKGYEDYKGELMDAPYIKFGAREATITFYIATFERIESNFIDYVYVAVEYGNEDNTMVFREREDAKEYLEQLYYGLGDQVIWYYDIMKVNGTAMGCICKREII